MKLIVTRPFLWEGQRLEIGAELESDDRGMVGLLVQTGKAAPVDDAPQRGPMTTDTAAAAVPGKAPRSGKTKETKDE